MQHFICKHWRLAKPMERRDVLLITAPDNSERLLTCQECYDAPNARQSCEHVSEMYFKILLDEVRKLARKQQATQAAN